MPKLSNKILDRSSSVGDIESTWREFDVNAFNDKISLLDDSYPDKEP